MFRVLVAIKCIDLYMYLVCKNERWGTIVLCKIVLEKGDNGLDKGDEGLDNKNDRSYKIRACTSNEQSKTQGLM